MYNLHTSFVFPKSGRHEPELLDCFTGIRINLRLGYY